jgi:DNA-binding MarR family transcriptional regulator
MEMDAAPAQGTITLLTRLSKAVHRRTPEALLGMRFRQFQTLCYLRDQGSRSQQELGEALLLDSNNLVLLLNELEAAGFAQRRRDPGDRRRHLVEVTPAGRIAAERAERAQEAIEDEVLGALSLEERAQLRELLGRALRSATRVPDPASLPGESPPATR